jgi:hypothetical protein
VTFKLSGLTAQTISHGTMPVKVVVDTIVKKHSCHNGLKLLPAQFFMLFGQDF